MRFKVDENLHEEVAVLLRQHGHDALTVYDQQMQGQVDDDVAAVCRQEGRAIVTQDLDGRDCRPAAIESADFGVNRRCASVKERSLLGIVSGTVASR